MCGDVPRYGSCTADLHVASPLVLMQAVCDISIGTIKVFLKTSGWSPSPYLGEAQTQNCQVQTVTSPSKTWRKWPKTLNQSYSWHKGSHSRLHLDYANRSSQLTQPVDRPTGVTSSADVLLVCPNVRSRHSTALAVFLDRFGWNTVQ